MKLNLIALALIGSILIATTQARWTSLKITAREYNDLPLTVDAATAQGWKKLTGCDSENSVLIGERYVLGDDESTVMIYNLAGEISGIATHVPEENAGRPAQFPLYNQAIVYDQEAGNFVMSAYFTEPDLICEPGSSSTFNRLIIKSQNIRLEAETSEANVAPGFTKGKCVPGLGLHYWAAWRSPVNAVTDPTDMMPGFLTYTDGELTGFGFAGAGASKWMATSPRYERPTAQVLENFVVELPNFVTRPDAPPFLSQHIFFTSDPASLSC